MHAAPYLMLIVMPLTGLLTTQLAGRVVPWFGLFEIPLFVDTDKELAEKMEGGHADVLWPVLRVLVGVHAGAAVWHHFILKDETLKRMLPFQCGGGPSGHIKKARSLRSSPFYCRYCRWPDRRLGAVPG